MGAPGNCACARATRVSSGNAAADAEPLGKPGAVLGAAPLRVVAKAPGGRQAIQAPLATDTAITSPRVAPPTRCRSKNARSSPLSSTMRQDGGHQRMSPVMSSNR